MHVNVPRENTIEAQRQRARAVLTQLSGVQIDGLLSKIQAGREVEALNDLRAIDQGSLAEAKEVIDRRREFGLHWWDSYGKP
ncbi:MAG: hypothetical protein AAGH42_00915 [Pseudomonadota bacterium]